MNRRGAGRKSRHHRALGHRRVREPAYGRRQEGYQPDRPIRRRILFGLHGGRQGRGHEPQGRRERGLALGLRRQRRVHDRGRREGSARHHDRRCICARAKKNFSSRRGCASSSRPIPTISPCRSCSRAGKEETINTASALWTRPQIRNHAEQYKEFYHHVATASMIRG